MAEISRAPAQSQPDSMSDNSRLLITIAVMLSAIMVLLDLTIANVALPHMMGALGVTSDQVTWVLTSYSMAEAIFIPLASFLTLRVGIRKLLLISVSGFVISSALCGQADSITEMVIFRIMQGAFGAAVIPLSQSIMVQIYPANQRGKAMAMFSVGILLGPILGPTLGGIITEHLDWRWIFYVNAPIGLICLTMLFFFVKLDGRGPSTIDWPLVIAMAIGIGLLQMVLDRGNQESWFASNEILFSTIISAIAIIFFIARSIYTKGDIAPVWLLKDRNLAMSCIVMAGFSMGMFGITQLQPMMLEQLLNYPVETTGFVMAPRGLVSAAVLLIMAQYMDRLDPRKLIAIGLVLNALGTYFMMQYSLEIDLFWVLFPSMIQGAGMGLVFAPLSQLAYTTLAPKDTVGGAVCYNLCRTIGGSFGISIVNTYFFRTQQQEWNELGGSLSESNLLLQQLATERGTTITDPSFLALIQQLLSEQSTLTAFVFTFGFLMVSYLALLPFLIFFKLVKKNTPAPVE
ncbi:DHA2 family efflux MFS transporter permease subunit [Vibrio sp. SM6]|uniref:DHA2 family efflux MFS transporter permease subunit n=1 Tax=Vibrio agarilyticus TaxID=2726741 RepID=A0A7X8TT94_9VIBR|nr:DHA2 family efflux MFS transporter permease subunit [Vibrio agarilyticus]NLS14406.1 DHA2 family efflux MFS transporter permease subunit [Vibrio agarilyticus]